MFASGIPLFLSEAIKAYYSFACFGWKMSSLFLVLRFYTFAAWPVVQRELSRFRTAVAGTFSGQ